MVKRAAEPASDFSVHNVDKSTTDATQTSTARSKRRRVSRDLVRLTNAMEPFTFHSEYFDESWRNYERPAGGIVTRFDLSPKFAKSMSTKEFDTCYDLVETTSRKDYEGSSQGWKPAHKRREMRESDMHYVLVSKATASYPVNGTSTKTRGKCSKAIEGFLSFMICYESSPVVPVLYIYEIHLAETARKMGLGVHLMRIAEGVADNVGLAKVMLTCFVSNTAAHGFYSRQGYTKDPSSPENREFRNKVVVADYIIMSKPTKIG